MYFVNNFENKNRDKKVLINPLSLFYNVNYKLNYFYS